MATKLFLRNTTANGITDTGDGVLYDMLAAAGSASDTDVVNTAASGTEIQWTQTGGGSSIAFISGRAPAGGFTLTTTDISVWCHESNMSANAGGRFRVFKRTAAGVVSELGGGPFSDGVEFGTAAAEMLWVGNVTDTAFAEDDRILIRVHITNVGTMGGGFTCTLTFNAADAATGDSFFNIAETVSFKANANPQLVTPGTASLTLTAFVSTVSAPRLVTPGVAALVLTAFIPTVRLGTIVTPGVLALTLTAFVATVRLNSIVTPGVATLTLTAFVATVTVGTHGTSTSSTTLRWFAF